jgi:hypothetical protein
MPIAKLMMLLLASHFSTLLLLVMNYLIACDTSSCSDDSPDWAGNEATDTTNDDTSKDIVTGDLLERLGFALVDCRAVLGSIAHLLLLPLPLSLAFKLFFEAIVIVMVTWVPLVDFRSILVIFVVLMLGIPLLLLGFPLHALTFKLFLVVVMARIALVDLGCILMSGRIVWLLLGPAILHFLSVIVNLVRCGKDRDKEEDRIQHLKLRS